MPTFVTRSSIPPIEEFIEEIRSLWDTKWLTNNGEKHNSLEFSLQKFLGVPFISLFTNGHLALEMVLQALGLSGEIITTPFTFASTTHAIVRNGLTPVFCDIKESDFTMDPELIESYITEKTSAILPVHVYGNVCDLKRIQDLADKYHLKVIYDAAHAFGETFEGKGIGSFGDASMFSFHATKVFNTIEGGAITTNSEDIKMTLDLIKNFGIIGPEEVVAIGGNAKMNEFQAAMGLCNLRHVHVEIEKRKLVVEQYIKNLTGMPGIKLNLIPETIESNYAYMPVVFDSFKNTRDEVFEKLRSQEVHARKYFYPTTNSFACYKNRFNPSSTPVAQYLSERVLTLPLYAGLSVQDVDKICDIIIS